MLGVDLRLKAVVVLALLGWWTMANRHDASQRAVDRVSLELQAEKDRQIARAVEVSQTARSRADQAEQEMMQLQERHRDLLEKLAQPNGTCTVDPDIRDRLRAIR